MPRPLNFAAASLLGMALALPGNPGLAAPPAPEEVFGVLGMAPGQIAELAQGRPVAYALDEGSADELAVALAWYLPAPVAEVVKHLRQGDPDLLDVDVTAHGVITEQGGPASLSPIALSKQEAEAMLEAGPGDEFNLSAHEISGFKHLQPALRRTPGKAFEEAVSQHYRELLFHRVTVYRRGGTEAIAPYAREESLDSKPSLELRQSANETPFLARYWPALHKAWLDYPKTPLPPGVVESFPWVEKDVESRPAAILRHRVDADWNGCVLVLTREIYAAHSYNSSQWITGCVPYRDGVVVFQQVRSYTDQVAGVGSPVKHVVGRELLKDKMIKAFERLCGVLGRCR